MPEYYGWAARLTGHTFSSHLDPTVDQEYLAFLGVVFTFLTGLNLLILWALPEVAAYSTATPNVLILSSYFPKQVRYWFCVGFHADSLAASSQYLI
jgi:hypothetical protein